MSELISETVRDIVSQKLGIRLSETLDDEIINTDKQVFASIIDEVEEELSIFIGDGSLEEIETCRDLIDTCEELQEAKEEQRRKNGA